MSAAFHVEFWESTPTNTHKTILQQALDGLVECIEERGGEFAAEADVAALIGRVFALYCAYSVQLGSPKHKIDVDPQDWTALITVNCVMCGVGATMFPSAAREVRAMMHRLVVQEDAFLRCLQGFGPSVRAQDSTRKRPAHQDLPPAITDATDKEIPIKQSTLDQLKTLNDRYQEIVNRARSSVPALSSSGSRSGGRQGLPTSQLSSSMPRETGNDGQDLIRGLKTYMEYKQNEEARKTDRVIRAAAARELEAKEILEVCSSERGSSSNILGVGDRGSVMRVPLSPIARSVASNGPEPHHRRDSNGSEAFLAELESELHADISSDQAIPISTSQAMAGRHSTAFSEISEGESDALADLERELEQSLDGASSRAKTVVPARLSASAPDAAPTTKPKGKQATRHRTDRGGTKQALTATQRRETRSSALSVMSDSSELMAQLQAELDYSDAPSNAVPKATANARTLASSDGIRSLRSSRLSSVASDADNDALEELERELNASTATATQPPVAKATTSATQKHRMASFKRPAQHSGAPARRNTKRIRVSTPVSEAVPATNKFFKTSDKQQVNPSPITLQKSTRKSNVSSDTESDGLAELISELDTPVTAEASAAQRKQLSAKIPQDNSSKKPNISTQHQYRSQHDSQGASTQQKRSTAKKTSAQSTDGRKVPSSPKAVPPRSVPSRSKAAGMGLRRSARLSSIPSDTESDGLEDLMAELESAPDKQPASDTKKPRVRAKKQPSRAQEANVKRKPGPKAKSAASVSTRKPRAPRKTSKQNQSASQKKAAPSSTHRPKTSLVVPPSSRRSTRSSSAALDSDSDGLAELEAELEHTAVSGITSRNSELVRFTRAREADMGWVDDIADEESADLAFRVELLRTLIAGDLPSAFLQHVPVLSDPFTAAMPPWTLQWEGMHWWMLQNATPLFVASAYSRPDVVRWLLINGADRSTPCYLKQTPAQVVGECCAHAALPDRTRAADAIVADSAKCVKLLDEPPSLPSPPMCGVAFSSSYSSEVVIMRNGSFKTSSIQQTVYKCVMRVSWTTPLSNGAIIDKYELRYRRLVSEDENEANANQDEGRKGELEKRSPADSSVTWRSEKVPHNRKSRQQNALIEGLQFNTIYEFMFRSWNAAGKGDWGPAFQTKTPVVPIRSEGGR
ncbi:unnamed protein product [Phytophthora fragariaefolia]|uniref:Unnamed protein product n=1 Tax=Phytophthora fragariaefolia TaxID=1490495 RepID=A0A9W7CX68_9STRA|nr:unnamed protein product [Phytophthora fragariaefolia]